MSDIDCDVPPVDPIPVIFGIFLNTSIFVSHNFMLLSSSLYTK